MKRVTRVFSNDSQEALVLTFMTEEDNINLEEAIKNACKEYCRTEEGKKVYSGNCHSFNWGDLDLYVPAAICRKHGFYIVQSYNAVSGDFNEQLVTESDIFPEE